MTPTAPRTRAFLAVALVLGVSARVLFYLARPSLTIDETTLALDIGMRSFRDLLHPLASLQTGPPLFLLGVKLCTVIGGVNEYALRLIPLTAGVVIPYLVWKVGRRVLPEPAAALATVLAALAPALIQYTVTAKPYITDALVALLFLWCTLDVLDHPDGVGVWAWWVGAGVLAVLSSIPAPFLLAGAAVAVILEVRPLTRRTAGRLVAGIAVWGAGWILLYTQLYRPVAGSWYMQQFWGPAAFTATRADGWWNLARSVFMSLGGRAAPPAVILPCAVLLVAGFRVWLRRLSRGVAALIAVPLALLLVASALQRYPLAARLLIFAVPAFVCALAALSSDATGRWTRRGWIVGGIAVPAFIGVMVSHPYRPASTRQAVDSLERWAKPGEAIYVASGGIPSWAFYSTDWTRPDTAYLDWIERQAGRPGAAAFHNTPPRGHAVGVGDGDSLWTWRAGRIELLGLASGIQWREGRGFGIPVVADSGWSSREAARIRAVASPTVLLFEANAYPTTVQQLHAAIAELGGTAVTETAVGGVRVTRFRFPPDHRS